MLNVELLQKVKQHILEEPARLRMLNWLEKGEPGSLREGYTKEWGEEPSFTFPRCGTVGCIAGWICELSDQSNTMNYRASAHGLLFGESPSSPSFEEAAQWLFYVDSWPMDIRDRYYAATDQTTRASLVAECIDRFIAEHAEVAA